MVPFCGCGFHGVACALTQAEWIGEILETFQPKPGLNAAAVGLLVPTMFVVYDTLQVDTS